MFTRAGLTGGIAAGKSTVAERFADLGAYVIDYDQLAHDAVAPGSQGLQEIVRVFGRKARATDGTMNRAWMAQHVFHDDEERAKLNAIIHPIVFRQAGRLEYQWLAKHPAPRGKRNLVIHDIPLLVETGRTGYFDTIITVEAPESLRIKRMVKTRGMSRKDAQARIRAQASSQMRLDVADYVIDSAKSLEHMYEDIDRLYAILTRPVVPISYGFALRGTHAA